MEDKEFKSAVEKIDAEINKCKDIISEGLTKQEKGLEGTAETLTQVKASMTKAEEKILSLEEEKKGLEGRISELEVKGQRPGFGDGGDKPFMATAGQQFILSDQFQGAVDRKDSSVERVEMKSLFRSVPMEEKQIAGATRGDLAPDRAPVVPQYESEYIYGPGQRQIRLFDLMQSSPTTSNAIKYFREVLDDSYDGPGSQENETHEKNQMSMNFLEVTDLVETIAAWLPASRQVLDDAPQLQAYIDGRLRYFVMAEAERQLLYGTGTAGEILGIMNTPGVQTIGPPTGNQTTLDIIRLASALVRVREYQATGVVLHPNDWADIELLKDNDLRYIWVQVPNGGEMRLWRIPVVETTVITEGQFLLGAFGLGAKVWDRQQASVRVSEHHEDFFIRNAVAILAEMRMALTVYRPAAFVMGTISSAASS